MYCTGNHQQWKQNLCLSEDVRAELVAFLQDALGLLRGDVNLQTGRHGRVDETGDDGGDLLLDDGLVTVGVTKVLRTREEATEEKGKAQCELLTAQFPER